MTPADQAEEDPMREFARSLFAPAAEDETDETDDNSKPSGNFVPREGANLEPAPDADKAMREYVRDLFGDDLNFRNT